MRYLSIALIVLLVSSATWAQQIVTDRPDQTEASSTVPKQSFQIESGFIAQFSGSNNNKSRNLGLPTTLFRYGLFNWMEVRLVSELAVQRMELSGRVSKSVGIKDLQIGTKVQLFKKEGNATEVAFLTHIIVPSGTAGVTSGSVGSINKLSISHGLAERVGLGYNVGYDYLGSGSGNLTYSVSVAFGITDKLGVFLEPYGSWDNFSSATTNFDSGFTYLIKDNLQYDFSFGVGLDNRMNFLSTGISWNIAQNE